MTYYTLFVIDLESRRVHIAGSTRYPSDSFMAQVARNLTDCVEGFLLPHRYLICDSDSKFSERFRILRNAGVETVLTPHRAPNCNAVAERFVRSIKEECLSRMTFFVERSLQRAIREYVEHYHRERPHQGFGNKVIDSVGVAGRDDGEIRCEERLGGILAHYRRGAERWDVTRLILAPMVPSSPRKPG